MQIKISVELDTINYVSTAYFDPQKFKKKEIKKFFIIYKRYNATFYSGLYNDLKRKKNDPDTMTKQHSKVTHNQPQFSFQYCQLAQNQLKTRPNLNFCYIKIAHRATYV